MFAVFSKILKIKINSNQIFYVEFSKMNLVLNIFLRQINFDRLKLQPIRLLANSKAIIFMLKYRKIE